MRCGVTKKVMFKSQRAAIVRAEEILQEDSNRNVTPLKFRAYQCEFCGGFHLTGKINSYSPQTREIHGER